MPATKQEPRYDLFISYRRGAAYELAMLLQNQLHQRGLAAFLDRDLRRGVFDETLLRNIEKSTSFLVILTANALDRCSDQDDWLRREIVHAISSKRNIIPLQVDSFQFTADMVKKLDPALQELSRFQAVEYSRTYFESTIERIVKIVEEDKAERTATQATETAKEKKLSAERAEKERREKEKLQANRIAAEGTQAERKDKKKVETVQSDRSGNAPGTVEVSFEDGQRYVWVPPGMFQMGCSSGDIECNDDEKPAHVVTITKGFWIGQTPVTQDAYERVMHKNPSYFHGGKLPVEVTWDQANAYCEAVGGRLPTEAEWEYAARAGTKTARYGDIDAIAWYDSNSGDTQINTTAPSRNDPAAYIEKLKANGNRTHAVAQKQPNAWGLYDMLGNVWEWVKDWYDENYYAKPTLAAPKGPTSGEHRVLRGGSWFDELKDVRSSCRGRGTPYYSYDFIGFRCVLETIPGSISWKTLA